MNTVVDKEKAIFEIMSDIANYVRQRALSMNIALGDYQDPSDLFLSYIGTMNKTFSYKMRNVIISQTLKHRMASLGFLDEDGNVVDERVANDICSLINDFCFKFQNGEDITNHLSKGIFSSTEDIVLNNWNLRHLHLSDIDVDVDRSAMSNNRSKWLLFFIVTDSEVAFVDVVCHPKGAGFTAFRFLEIIQNNGWMEKIGFHEIKDMVPGSLKPKIVSDEDIYMLYKNHLNIPFEINGKVYSSPGVTSNGYKIDNMIRLNHFKKSLEQLLDENEYIELKQDIGEYEILKLIFKAKDGDEVVVEIKL